MGAGFDLAGLLQPRHCRHLPLDTFRQLRGAAHHKDHPALLAGLHAVYAGSSLLMLQPAVLAQQQQQLAIPPTAWHNRIWAVDAARGAPQAAETDAGWLRGDLGGAVIARDSLKSLLDSWRQRQRSGTQYLPL